MPKEAWKKKTLDIKISMRSRGLDVGIDLAELG